MDKNMYENDNLLEQFLNAEKTTFEDLKKAVRECANGEYQLKIERDDLKHECATLMSDLAKAKNDLKELEEKASLMEFYQRENSTLARQVASLKRAVAELSAVIAMG